MFVTCRIVCVAVAVSAVPALAGRQGGVDVSHFQGSTGIAQSTWNSFAASGVSFAIIKATEGLTGPDDAAMANNVSRATAANILTGVYHYPHAENRPTTAGAIQEADHFMTYAGSAIGPGHLRPVLDLEGNSLTLSTAALTDWVLAFVGEVIAVKGPAAEPIIYATRSTAAGELDSRVANLDLWLAYYPGTDPFTTDPPPTASFPDPTGQFDNWALWQFTASGSLSGISPLDEDVVHSEYKPLSALLIPEPAVVICGSAIVLPRRRRHV